MKFSQMLITAAMSCFIALGVANAADMNGHWWGHYTVERPGGEPIEMPIYMILKQDGNKLTGSAGENVDDRPNTVIGKIEGDKVELDVTTARTGRTNHIVGTMKDGRITGKSSIPRLQDDKVMEAEVVLKPVR